MKTYTYTVTFTVPDHIQPDAIKDAVGAAIRCYIVAPDDVYSDRNRQILDSLRLTCEGIQQ